MKPENWTDCEHPCFEDYEPNPLSMTKEQLIAEADNIEDCDGYTADDCNWKQGGRGWQDCKGGRLSKHCNWLPKEGTNA